ncbi:dolichyl-phosphate-mannose-protein mannosyltransferase [Xanthomonas fragariae]|uniref:Dolichyl-phosphate-mannose-protein mannosyltransferase n=1 Tax=Xanthomonas fragariae TaxID=48664 RepID=A0A1Y6H6L9_9XANT|nr:dolichyl-phosphate-mannose-protein mannosyltransferase [Xanthomonas fragariae]SMQ98161.1 hypothetical protein PD885_00902 [Xanthomonas fragariae]SMR04375.1 dolichyl-phosphate-mannose-protein mannosyltransferase [Xanthomonas fragariae]
MVTWLSVVALVAAGVALGGGISLHLHWAENIALKREMDLVSMQSAGLWLIGLGMHSLAAVAWPRSRRAGIAVVV